MRPDGIKLTRILLRFFLGVEAGSPHAVHVVKFTRSSDAGGAAPNTHQARINGT